MKEIEEKLTKIGLTSNQSKIYLSVLKLRKATIKEIAKDCGFHRTNIYDIIEELKEKGVITFAKEGKSTYYSAIDPKNLSVLIDEKKEILNNILPALEGLFNFSQDSINVQVYKGEQGMKIAFNNILKTKNKKYYGLNIKGQLREQLPIYAAQFYRIMKEKNISYKGIYTKEYTVKGYKTDIRYIDPKYDTPVATHIYDDVVLIQIWQPTMIAIEIKSQQIADAYKDHFDIMWKEANKKPIKEK